MKFTTVNRTQLLHENLVQLWEKSRLRLCMVLPEPGDDGEALATRDGNDFVERV